MQDFLYVTGMVIHQSPVNDYDRRIVLLTKSHGKITAFAKGARRQTSKFIGATDLFAFGEFKLYAGKEAYSLVDTKIEKYFEDIRKDFNKAIYGMYFLEVCEFCTRENNDEYDILKLLYYSVLNLLNNQIPDKLVKIIFEFKLYCLLGQFAIDEKWLIYKKSTIYTLEFIINTKTDKLFSFIVSDEVFEELQNIEDVCRTKIMPHVFKSEEMLKVVEL